MPPEKSTPLPSAQPARAPNQDRSKPIFRFRMRITEGDVILVGPGKIALVEAIAKTGSITAAAKSLDMSYRRAWLLLEELNRSLCTPAVESVKGGRNGGGSQVTDAGRQLIEIYRRIEETSQLANQADIERLIKLLAR